MDKKKASIIPLFSNPLMEVQLDLDLEKLTEFSFQMQNKDKPGILQTNKGGWQSNDIVEETHEEFIKLKKEINQYLQLYHSQVFQGMVFKENIIQSIDNIWVNINQKYHYNEWHLHPHSTLSGAYYIKHDNSAENGSISFKHPNDYMSYAHWNQEIIKRNNELTSEIITFIPKSNMLLIFPSWLEHKVEINLKNDFRISLSFNATHFPEKNHNGKENENKT